MSKERELCLSRLLFFPAHKKIWMEWNAEWLLKGRQKTLKYQGPYMTSHCVPTWAGAAQLHTAERTFAFEFSSMYCRFSAVIPQAQCLKTIPHAEQGPVKSSVLHGIHKRRHIAAFYELVYVFVRAVYFYNVFEFANCYHARLDIQERSLTGITGGCHKQLGGWLMH